MSGETKYLIATGCKMAVVSGTPAYISKTAKYYHSLKVNGIPRFTSVRVYNTYEAYCAALDALAAK